MASLATILSVVLLTISHVVLAATPGCGKTPPSSGTKSIGNRQYILQVPANYDANKPYKLVFGYWLNGNMNNVAPGYYGLRALAGESAVFVAPNGLNAGWANAGGADVTFVDQILAQVQEQLCIDENQRYATGFSYGGSMTYALACARPNIFRAVSVIGGAQLSGCAGGETPVAYLGIHGVADNVLPIARGRELRDRYLRVDQCQSRDAPEPPAASGQHIKTV
ncbi:fungal cellulose binding domain-containing protein [Colletotrichum kahawae]|uniref:Feruloyl esterase C n=1 Tax=Colletotrichum kahawae TaxID=34407 RepID=A0AAD9Y785_COLKA|nr:fungal cellulose binding domain-containing protein [Colletotrichum kahawae]